MERIQLAAPGGDPRPGEATIDAAIARAAAVLNAGGIAILPAEGLYGLHARPDLSAALDRLKRIKPREEGRGWIGLIPAVEDLGRFAERLSDSAVALARSYWPGALTLVVRASPEAPGSLVADDGTIALRCPGSEFLRAVVAASGGIVLSTSANAPGAPPPTTAVDAGGEDVALIVDAGPLSGVPSTVVHVEGRKIRVLRMGAIQLPPGVA